MSPLPELQGPVNVVGSVMNVRRETDLAGTLASVDVGVVQPDEGAIHAVGLGRLEKHQGRS